MSLSDAQITVALEWWAKMLAYMYALSERGVSVFRDALNEQLAGGKVGSIDARSDLPEELRAALATVGVGENARYRLRGHMCFPSGGVLICDGLSPFPETTAAKKRRLTTQLPAFVRSSIDALPVSVLLPFAGMVVWEQGIWYCGKEYQDKQSGEKKRHDKVWAACLVTTCAEEETLSGRQPCLKWEYRVRYGPRTGSIKQEVMPFGSDEKETAQQKAATHYSRKVREQAKEYEPIEFDHSHYQVTSFTSFLTNAAFAV